MFGKNRTGWKHRKNQEAWLEFGILEMKEKPQPIQNTNKARQGHISNFPFHWLLKCSQAMATACLPAEDTTRCIPAHLILSLQILTLFLLYAFLISFLCRVRVGKLKFRSRLDPSCRAVVVALIKNPNWNKGQPAEALQPRLHGEKEKRNTSSYFSLH